MRLEELKGRLASQPGVASGEPAGQAGSIAGAPSGDELSDLRELRKELADVLGTVDPPTPSEKVQDILAKRIKEFQAAAPGAKARKKKRKSSLDSSSSEEGFGPARGAADGRGPRQVALRSPGELTFRTMAKVKSYLLDRQLPGGSSSSELVPCLGTYLSSVFIPSASGLPLRSVRELTTIAQAVDQLLIGNVMGATDTLLQRFKAVETAHSDNSWGLAEQLEIIPDLRITATDSSEREAAAKRLRAERKVELMAAALPKGPHAKAAH